MKILLVAMLFLSASAYSQTRVKENIKTQTLDSAVEQPKPAPVKKPRKTK